MPHQTRTMLQREMLASSTPEEREFLLALEFIQNQPFGPARALAAQTTVVAMQFLRKLVRQTGVPFEQMDYRFAIERLQEEREPNGAIRVRPRK